jgi:hypothetical protein
MHVSSLKSSRKFKFTSPERDALRQVVNHCLGLDRATPSVVIDMFMSRSLLLAGLASNTWFSSAMLNGR